MTSTIDNDRRGGAAFAPFGEVWQRRASSCAHGALKSQGVPRNDGEGHPPHLSARHYRRL